MICNKNWIYVFSALVCFILVSFQAFANEAKITVARNQYASEEKIIVSFSGFSGKEQDWITLVSRNSPDDTYGEYFYTKGEKQGSFTFAGLQPGEYEVRGYFDWPDGGYKVQARTAISVGSKALDSTPAQLSETPAPVDLVQKSAAVPPGSVFFTRVVGDATNLLSVKMDGTEVTEWTQLGNNERCVEPRFSSKGGVLFLHVKGMMWGLSVLDRSTKRTRILVEPLLKEEVKAAAWAPDGASVACTIGDGFKNDIYLVDLNGKRKKLTSIEGTKRDPLSWSADGRSILFTLHPPEVEGEATNYNNKDIGRVFAADGKNLNLTSDPGNSDAAMFSPDGKTIVFVHADIKSEQGRVKVMAYPEIWLMAADGSNKKKLTDGTAWDYQPVWSPNGKTIAFISSRSGGYDNLFIMNADGTGVKQLTEQDYTKKCNPAWTRNGQYICYMSEESWKRKLHVVSAEGGKSLEIASECVSFTVCE